VLDSPFSRLTDLMLEIVVSQRLPIPKVRRCWLLVSQEGGSWASAFLLAGHTRCSWAVVVCVHTCIEHKLSCIAVDRCACWLLFICICGQPAPAYTQGGALLVVHQLSCVAVDSCACWHAYHLQCGQTVPAHTQGGAL
jgi:hypothetical protein